MRKYEVKNGIDGFITLHDLNSGEELFTLHAEQIESSLNDEEQTLLELVQRYEISEEEI